MKKYYGGDDDGDNDGKEDGTDNDNVAGGSRSDCSIFDPIMMHRCRRRGSGDDSEGTVAVEHYVYTCTTIYLPYKYNCKDVP